MTTFDTGRREAGHTPAQDITPSAVAATKSSNLTTKGIPNLGHSAIVSRDSDECYKFTKCHIRNADGIHDDFFDNFTSVDDTTNESPVAELEKLPVYFLDVALASKSGYELEPPVNYYRSEVTDKIPAKPAHPYTTGVLLDEDKTYVVEFTLPPAPTSVTSTNITDAPPATLSADDDKLVAPPVMTSEFGRAKAAGALLDPTLAAIAGVVKPPLTKSGQLLVDVALGRPVDACTPHPPTDKQVPEIPVASNLVLCNTSRGNCVATKNRSAVSGVPGIKQLLWLCSSIVAASFCAVSATSVDDFHEGKRSENSVRGINVETEIVEYPVAVDPVGGTVPLRGVKSNILASDAIPDQLTVGSKVILSDEEILANNPELASMFEVLNDEDKFSKWEKEEMPGLLLEIEASKRKSSRKQKKWARKALMSSEVSICNRKNYWKDFAYGVKCRRWDKAWFVSYCGGGYYCDSGDTQIWPLCHHGCNGWQDDGTRCWKRCSQQSTATSECGTLMCTENTGACFGAVVNMIVSIASMLSNFIPGYGQLKAVGTKLLRVGVQAAKAVMKQIAKSIAKQLMRKAKRKVKKFMKAEVRGQIQQLKDSAVEAILQEAAEAFAIERTAQELKHEFPSIEDVARAIDPIGVMDVVDAFNHDDCSSTEIETFPTCSQTHYVSFTMSTVMADAEAECCFGYHTPTRVNYWFGMTFWTALCKTEGSHLSVRASTVNGTEDNLFDDDTDADPNNAVDVLWGPEQTYSDEDMALCMFCNKHASCSDNQVPGANLTMFEVCSDRGCCQSSSTDTQYSSASYLVQPNATADDGACSDCAIHNMCMSPGNAFEICSSMGCCKDTDDHSATQDGSDGALLS